MPVPTYGAVRVVVLEERNERGGDRDHLIGRHVHQLDHVGRDHVELAVEAGRDEVLSELALLVDEGGRHRDVLPLLFEGRVPGVLVEDATLRDLAVRRLDEAELVDAGVGRERRDESDVRTFRGLDRADAAVVRRVDVADLEARALAGQTARSKRGEAAFVRHLGERIGLVHELRQLRAAEVLLHHRGDRLRVDEIVRHERVDLLRHAHLLFDRALHADQTDAVLVLHELAHRADAAVAEVVDVVDRAAAVLELDEVADGLEDVLRREHGGLERRALVLGQILVELVVQLEATDLRQVVALRVEEQVVEQGLRRLERRRIAGTQATVDLHDRVLGRLDLLREQRVAEVRADVEAVDEEDLELVDAGLTELLELRDRHLFVHLDEDLTGLAVDHVVRGDFADELLGVDREPIDLRFLELLDRRLGELGVLLDNDFAAHLDVARRALAGEQIVFDALGVLARLLQEHRLGVVEVVEQILRRVPEGTEQDRRVHLPAAVDADVDDVLRVELEVEPRAAVRDDAGRVEQLARRVGLALVVVEEDARAAVQLADDDALGAVDDERTGVRHQRDLAEVDLLLLDVADDTLTTLAGVVDHELGRHLDRSGEGGATLAALLDVVLRWFEVVADEDELTRPVEILDGKDAPEDRLEPHLYALVLPDVRLQELVVARLLNVDQVGDFDDLLDLAEVLANPEVRLNQARHQRCSSRGSSKKRKGRSETRAKATKRRQERAGEIPPPPLLMRQVMHECQCSLT
jgi:hypothetical protein